MPNVGQHAVVCGASMAGMLAARVLTDHYDRVTVVERDPLTDDVVPRRGVPQGWQPHALLTRCAEILEELFPGYLDALVEAGAHRWDDGDLSRFDVSFSGHRMKGEGAIPDPGSLVQHYASRPLVEQHVRRRIVALPQVTIRDGHHVEGLTTAGSRVTGVRICDTAGAATTLDADLVVDASGRGSRAPVFLAELGYGRPDVEELLVRVAYASMPVRIPHGALRQHLIIRMFAPGQPRGFAMFRCESDTWLVAAATLGPIRPPATPAELLAFCKKRGPAYAVEAVRAGEPLGGVTVHQYPSNRWRRYDRMGRLPDGFVVVGDAVCSFNPVYGQGMTIAAIEATVLDRCLRAGEADLPRRFHRAAAKPVRVAWQTAVGSDLALPEVQGRPALPMRLTNAYTEYVLRAAEVDPLVTQDFLRVVGMVAPPGRLVHPAFMVRVARALRRRVPAAGANAPALTATGQ
ncbi:FAD-dependent oxidoreductase [Mycolicibacterium litorale]|uniref:Hydroxylase n=1 Tax=Mycolicibacterium litorale TaxID=758802 RepID=A0AAD1IQZ6_9MYCO|nr:FAD-dependent monooxygenase [Mycolicibacterium litorale]MCV7416750.1 FAD-dependent monooxygenase [Mycolicibacterium litorale]TDY10002.1 2-polyprenyl-6-methoxyphenol hydroxylase-like FAD-dependent oxidoreductase [Mycolicibacterium litorale]BBY17962.1 hydroxylase [Mycolicibacterium litorale]